MAQQRQGKLIRNETINRKKNKQKLNPAIYEHFLTLYSEHPNAIQEDNAPLEIQQLYELAKRKPQNRTQKMLKKISSELKELKCFKIPPLRYDKKQFTEIFRRDNETIASMIAPFVQITKYQKGSIIQATGLRRNSVKILLIGQLVIFEPISQNFLKKSQMIMEDNEVDMSLLLSSCLMLGSALSRERKHSPDQSLSEENKEGKAKTPLLSERSTIFDLILKQTLQTKESLDKVPVSKKPLTKAQCKNILIKFNIHFHQPSLYEPKNGDLVADKNQQMFIDQRSQYASTTICSTDCIMLQIGFEIAKQVINLINNDQERPFLQALLIKFPMLQYFQAKQYVTPNDIIIRKEREEEGEATIKTETKPILKELSMINTINHQIPYTGELYLIIYGNITLIINQVSERKPSTIDLVIPQKRILNKQLLSLYKNDVFGFEDIGKHKSANLRYLVAPGTKLLRINTEILEQHMVNIPGFEQEIRKMQKMRNQIISDLLHTIESNLESQEIKRHQAITYRNEDKLEKIKNLKRPQSMQQIQQIRELRYFGHQNYESVSNKIKKHFSPQNVSIPKRHLSPEIIEQTGLGLQFCSMLIKKSVEDIKIKDGMIEIRNSKGVLVRKKKLIHSQNPENNHHKSSLLRKIGVLNSKQIADHNLKMVKKRASKYQFEDLNKEAKELKRLRQKSESLPKLNNLFAKKQNRLFQILKKKRIE